MPSFDGSEWNVVGQAWLFFKIKGPNGYTPKKMLHCLIVNHFYDREILLSCGECLSYGMITNNCPYPMSEMDSEENEESKDES